MIAIIDYGLGNLGSIQNMLRKVGVEAVITSESATICEADKFILPGVGSFDQGMKNLRERDLNALLTEQVIHRHKSLLGICLGMQLLCQRSDEGALPGLGWIDAETLAFAKTLGSTDLKIPHMGWSDVHLTRSCPLFSGLENHARFYFVHSYYVSPKEDSLRVALTEYGAPFAAAVAHANIYGVQFHPEKSHRFGMRLLENFARQC